jgi:hypothetical protein
LIEDHLLTEAEALYKLNKETAERKAKCLDILRVERARTREERRRSRKEPLEAYLDSEGELRIRRVLDTTDDPTNGTDSSAEPQDLRRLCATETGAFEMKASDYLEIVCRADEFSFEGENSGVQSATNFASPARERNAPRSSSEVLNERPKRRVGRPRGSRTYGLTALKKVNRNVRISDSLMGERCGLNNCAVRLKVR